MPVSLSSAERTAYLTALHNCLVPLVQLMKKGSSSPSVSNYHAVFADIIGLYATDTSELLPDCTVSTQSGLPMLSKLLSIAHDQKNLLQGVSWREKKDIAADVMTTFYRGGDVDIFLQEFKKAHYYERLKDISQFDEQTCCEPQQGSASIDKYTLQYVGYPLTAMSIISVSAEFFHPRRGLSNVKPPIEEVKRNAGMPIESLYPVLTKKNIYCGQLEQTQLFFYFKGVENMPQEIADVIEAHPQGHILWYKRATLQNLDILVAENHLELRDAQFENLEEDKENIYVCEGMGNAELSTLHRRGEQCKIINV